MKNLKHLLVLAIALTLATVIPTLALVYWQRTIQKNFTVVGIDAELLEPTAEGYKNKVITSSLDAENKISLTILDENLCVIWLNLTWSSNADGVDVSATGQYYEYFLSSLGSNPVLEPVGDSFDVLGYHEVDKTKMMYYVPPTNTDSPGGLLMISFAFDTELVTIAGDYVVNLTFEMGFA